MIFWRGGNHQKNAKVNRESQNQLWHHQCLNLDNCQMLAPRLPPWICDGRQEDHKGTLQPQWFGNQLSPQTWRSSPCVPRQQISKKSQMANELMFILSREKNWGQAKFHCIKAKAQLSWHQQHLSCCWGCLQRGVFISQLWISSHETHSRGTHVHGRLCAFKDTAQENFWLTGVHVLYCISKSTAAHCSEGKMSPLQIRDHPRCIKTQDRSIISRNHNCTLHNSKY